MIFLKRHYREGRLQGRLEHGVGVVFGGDEVMVGVWLAERDLILAWVGEFCLLTFLFPFPDFWIIDCLYVVHGRRAILIPAPLLLQWDRQGELTFFHYYFRSVIQRGVVLWELHRWYFFRTNFLWWAKFLDWRCKLLLLLRWHAEIQRG